MPSPPISASPGRGLPPLAATSALPSATTEVAKSRMKSSPPGLGTPTAIGAVEHLASAEPNGATIRDPATLQNWTDTKPSRQACSA